MAAPTPDRILDAALRAFGGDGFAATSLDALADQLGIDILAATEAKMAENEKKYPADVVRGSAKKYTEY